MVSRTLSILTALVAVSTAQAVPTTAVGYDHDLGAGTFVSAPRFTGFKFSIDSAIDVVSLGFWESPNGIYVPRDVGLFSDAGTLLASASITAGAAGVFADGDFLFVDISPVALAVGTYRIAATNGSAATGYDGIGLGGSSGAVTAATGINVLGAVWDHSFTFPSIQPTGDDAYFGANFRFEAAAATVPEGGSVLGLLAVVLTAVVGGRRNRPAVS